MLTFAERPHGLLDDEEVLLNLRNSVHCLMIPVDAGDLGDVILSCWNRYDYDRPSFSQLNHYFHGKQQFVTRQSEKNGYQQIRL